MLLIIDNGSIFIKHMEKHLKEWDIPFKVFGHSEKVDIDALPKVKGVILSGGPGDPYGPENITTDFKILMNLEVPIIGFCLGHEIIAVAYGGMVEDLPEKQSKLEHVFIDKKGDPIFAGLGKEVYLREKHNRHVSKLPHDFDMLGHSAVCDYEIIRHKGKIIYGFQSHPEASGEDGAKIMRNFLRMCGEEI